MSSIHDWSLTAPDNGSADADINWRELQDPDTVNDSARMMMQRLASWRNDLAARRTATGSGGNYVVTSETQPDALTDTFIVWFLPNHDNPGSATLKVDSFAAKPLRGISGQNLLGGEIVQSAPIGAIYNPANDEFLAINSAASAAQLVPEIVDRHATGVRVGDPILSLMPSPRNGRVRLTESTQALNKADWPELNQFISEHGYPWGSDTLTFNLPPAAGYFLRFAPTSSTIDPDGPRGAGSIQQDEIKSHNHEKGSLGGHTSVNGAHNHTYTGPSGTSACDFEPQIPVITGTGTLATSIAGDHNHSLVITGSVSHTGGAETRSKNVTMHVDIVASAALANADVYGVNGLPYKFNSSVAGGDPLQGRIAFDNTDLTQITSFSIHEETTYQGAVGGYLDVWAQGGHLHVFKVGAPGSFAIIGLDSAFSDNGGWRHSTASHVSSGGSFSDDDAISILYYPPGFAGPEGLQGPAGANGEQGPEGPEGPQGPVGPAGDRPVYPTPTDLNTAIPSPSDGQSAEVTSTATIWSALGGTWSDTGVSMSTPGPQGPEGPQGPAGADGQDGGQGPQGPAGQGLPVGGSVGQVARKASGTDFDVEWADPASGGGDLLSTNNLSDVTSASTARQNISAAPLDALGYYGLQVNGFQQHSQEHGSNAVGPGNRPVDEELFISSNGTMTAQRVASPFLSRPDIPYGIELSVGTGAALGASDEIQVSQNIEGTRLHGKLAWGGGAAKPISIGRVIRSNVTGRGYVSVRNVLVNRSLVYHFDLTADTDTYVEISIDGDTTGGWSTDTNVGLVVTWAFGAGSSLTTGTLDEWLATNVIAGNDVTNFFSATGNKVWLGPMVILPGNELPAFSEIMKCQRHFDDELRSCQRYYVREQQAGVYTNDTIFVLNGFQIRFPVAMRTVPAIAFHAGGMAGHHSSPPDSAATTLVTGCSVFWNGSNYRNYSGTGDVEYSANARM